MKVYADSSFLIRLVMPATDAGDAMDAYRRAGRPRLLFLPVHELEVYNGILQRAFYDSESGDRQARREASRMKETALSRVERMLQNKLFLRTYFDWDTAIQTATAIAFRHSEKVGARAIDILHIAFASCLRADLFITADRRQGKLALLEGLKLTPAFTD